MSRMKTIVAALLYLSSDKTASVVQQLTFLVALLAPVCVLVLLEPLEISGPGLLFGLSLVGLATVLVLLSPSGGPRSVVGWIVPCVDILACGVLRIATAPGGAVISSLVLVPALWLALRFRARGAAVAVVLVLVSITGPSLAVLEGDFSFSDVARYLVLPVTMVLLAMGVLGILQRQDDAILQSQKALIKQREASRELSRKDARLRGVIEHLAVGVLVMDGEGNDVMTNQAQRELHSLVSPPDSSDPTEAGHVIYHVDGSPIPLDERPAARANAGESFDNLMFRAGPPGPDQRVISCTARIIEDEAGARDSVFLMFRDVTVDMNLLQAQQDVIAAVSHEMRTPLTSIVGFTDFAADSLEELESTAARDDVEEYLKVIRRSAEKLSTLVEDLLLQQQAALGKLALNMEPVNIANLARECAAGFLPLAQERNIAIELDLRSGQKVPADVHRTVQVIDNLISNAVKYTQRGGRIRVSAADTDAGVSLTVADNGPGMTRAEASRVFTPFYRAATARASAKPGAGLGLALTKSIVDAHGGTITVFSVLGQGSTFTMTLPHTDVGPNSQSELLEGTT